ncbi:hypothetical protein P8452_56853 [Trifolium repens]|nr:hypothetical protein P8452_56853 [Trifolium repens]
MANTWSSLLSVLFMYREIAFSALCNSPWREPAGACGSLRSPARSCGRPARSCGRPARSCGQPAVVCSKVLPPLGNPFQALCTIGVQEMSYCWKVRGCCCICVELQSPGRQVLPPLGNPFQALCTIGVQEMSYCWKVRGCCCICVELQSPGRQVNRSKDRDGADVWSRA